MDWNSTEVGNGEWRERKREKRCQWDRKRTLKFTFSATLNLLNVSISDIHGKKIPPSRGVSVN
jgi:hypothetical protein